MAIICRKWGCMNVLPVCCNAASVTHSKAVRALLPAVAFSPQFNPIDMVRYGTISAALRISTEGKADVANRGGDET